MKRLSRLLLLVLLAVIAMPSELMAQADPMATPLPLDPEVRYGVLPNGLTYYIRHNEYPKGQADFYIAQKVGSILEEDNQRGLAHFLEHMCFNGTENFPGNDLVSWLETVGVKFGRNLNAYTSIDQTVYNISNVPVDRVGVQDSCLLILHDWADGLLLDPAEIDKERGVIHQEWRMSNKGQMRIIEQLLPVMYPGSKYGYRLPIGTMEVVDNFPPQALRDYYEAWYRPDQQGIIVVGDIDVDRIESKIQELFGPIQMPADAKPREYFPVPDHEGTIYAIGRDVEMPNTMVELMFLSDVMPDEMKNTPYYYLQEYIETMVASMLNQRLSDLSTDPNCVFSGAQVDFDNYFVSRTKDAFTVYAMSKTDEVEPSLEAVYREVLRAFRGGFTESEYERARSEFMSQMETAYNNRATRKNDSYVSDYVNNFVEGVAAPGIETDYQLYQQMSMMIPVDVINMMVKEVITPDNRVVLAMTPEKEGVVYPTEESLAAVIASVEAEDLEAYVDDVKTDPLIANLPAPGKVVKTIDNTTWDATEWELSNGVRVLVKTTDFKDDEILFTAVANGGTNMNSKADAPSVLFMPLATSTLGFGDYTNKDLTKYLQGKNVSIEISIDDYTRDVEGHASPRDLNTLMELIYSAFTQPNIDATEFAALQSAYAGYFANMMLNPDVVFSSKVLSSLYNDPRKQFLTPELINAANVDVINEMIRGSVANAADYTFVFVGNVTPETLKPLVEQYIATLPANVKKATKGQPKEYKGYNMKAGKGVDEYFLEMETPQTSALIVEWGKMDYTPKSRLLASIAGQILTTRLIESVREREGAVYSISAQGVLYRVEPQNAIIQSRFPMTPDKKDLVLGMIEQEFANMASEVTPEELNKVKEYLLKSYIEDTKSNSTWLGSIAGFYRNGVDTFNGYTDVLGTITPQDVADYVKALNAQGNYRVVLLSPATK